MNSAVPIATTRFKNPEAEVKSYPAKEIVEALNEQLSSLRKVAALKEGVGSLAEVGKDFAKNYEIKAIIGQGMISTVFQAKPFDETKEPLAIKVLKPQWANKEISFLGFLEPHPYITPILREGIFGKQINPLPSDHFVIMPLFRNGDLYRKVRQEGPIPLDEIVLMAQQLLKALAHIEAKEICHGDVKPLNILYDEQRGAISLTDFGSAFQLEQLKHQTPSFTAQPLCYRAPEILLFDTHWEKTDVWAAGCSLFYLFTGKELFFENSLSPSTQFQDELDLLYQIEKMIRPLSSKEIERAASEKKALYLDQSHFSLKNEQVSPTWSAKKLLRIQERIFAHCTEKQLTITSQVTVFSTLLEKMIAHERPSAKELLSHSFFQKN